MVAIKDMEMPKNCVECNHMDLQQAINCQLIYSGCANCGRHPNCPLVDIEERKVVKCTDCEDYNQEKHYCPKFCNVIRDTTKEIQEFYKGEHEKLEKIEQIVNCELIAGKHDYKACYTAFYEIVDVIQDREVLEQDN